MIVGFCTAPRENRYLVRSLRSLFETCGERRSEIKVVIAPTFIDPAEDWDRVRELIGPGGEVLEPMWAQTREEYVADKATDYIGREASASEAHRGLEHNSDRLLKDLCARGDQYFFALQDDVEFCRSGMERILQIADVVNGGGLPGQDSVGMISFYSPYSEFGHSVQGRALVHYPSESFYGELALLWNREAAAQFVAASNPGIAHDLMIQAWYVSQGARWRILAHSPCLVQHTGVDSATGKVWLNRQTMNYCAERDAVFFAKPL